MLRRQRHTEEGRRREAEEKRGPGIGWGFSGDSAEVALMDCRPVVDRANQPVKCVSALSEEGTFATASIPVVLTVNGAVTGDTLYLNWGQEPSSLYFSQDATDKAADISQSAVEACLERPWAEQHSKTGPRGR